MRKYSKVELFNVLYLNKIQKVSVPAGWYHCSQARDSAWKQTVERSNKNRKSRPKNRKRTANSYTFYFCHWNIQCHESTQQMTKNRITSRQAMAKCVTRRYWFAKRLTSAWLGSLLRAGSGRHAGKNYSRQIARERDRSASTASTPAHRISNVDSKHTRPHAALSEILRDWITRRTRTDARDETA